MTLKQFYYFQLITLKLFLSIPAFSISSIKTIGDFDKIAVSAIIKGKQLDCPPLKLVIGLSKSNFSPASSLA